MSGHNISTSVSDVGGRHEFLCAGKTWSVTRHTSLKSRHTGLSFGRDDETRFLEFTQGALPSDRELKSMSEEVLCVFLLRAVAQ
jgi:hypothetical protein